MYTVIITVEHDGMFTNRLIDNQAEPWTEEQAREWFRKSRDSRNFVRVTNEVDQLCSYCEGLKSQCDCIPF